MFWKLCIVSVLSIQRQGKYGTQDWGTMDRMELQQIWLQKSSKTWHLLATYAHNATMLCIRPCPVVTASRFWRSSTQLRWGSSGDQGGHGLTTVKATALEFNVEEMQSLQSHTATPFHGSKQTCYDSKTWLGFCLLLEIMPLRRLLK